MSGWRSSGRACWAGVRSYLALAVHPPPATFTPYMDGLIAELHANNQICSYITAKVQEETLCCEIFNSARYMQQLRITITSKERCKYNQDSQTPEFSHLIVRQMQRYMFIQRKDEMALLPCRHVQTTSLNANNSQSSPSYIMLASSWSMAWVRKIFLSPVSCICSLCSASAMICLRVTLSRSASLRHA